MGTDWEIKEIRKNRGLLYGTIRNHECDPKEDCPECGGDGRCVKCGGEGDVDCHVCHGSGRCRDCDGRGKSRCDECGGSGRCRVCGGSGKILCSKCHGTGKVFIGGNQWKLCTKCGGAGYAPCPECTSLGMKAIRFGFGTSARAHGSGKCKKCEGTGELICKTCNGTGDCNSCGGSGKETCKHCHGDGKCPNCDGTGKVTCKRCKGSGWYQTFDIYDASLYSKKWQYISDEQIEKGINMAVKRPVYNDTYKKWKFRNDVDFDKFDDVRKKTDMDFGTSESFKKFEKAYEMASAVSKTTDTPYSKSIEIGKVPVTKIDFKLNNNSYSAYVLGDNSVIMCDELPIKVEMYKTSFFKKIIMSFTNKKRHIAYIKLAAYIFQCDGKNADESRVLNAFLSELNYDQNKLSKLYNELKKFNAEMPYKTFRKEITTLFSSKKTLTFAWQCMAVDKNLSPSENQLFEELSAEYKLNKEDIESIKKAAPRLSILANEDLVKEYMRS